MKKFINDNVGSNSLSLDLKMLSLEDMPAGESTSIFNQALPKLVSEFKHLKEGLALPITSLFSSKEKRVLSHLKDLNYMNLSQSLVTTPEGFKGLFLDYLQVLEKVQTQAYKDANEFIKEYHLVLSSFITNKDDQVSAKDLSFFYNRVEQRTLEFSKEISRFFDAPNKLSRQKLGTVISRLSDVAEIAKVSDQIESSHNVKNLKDIEGSLSNVIAMLDIIIDQMQKQDTTKVSRQAALNISQGAYNLARYIEFISLTHFRTSVMLKVTEDLFTFLNKQL